MYNHFAMLICHVNTEVTKPHLPIDSTEKKMIIIKSDKTSNFVQGETSTIKYKYKFLAYLNAILMQNFCENIRLKFLFVFTIVEFCPAINQAMTSSVN